MENNYGRDIQQNMVREGSASSGRGSRNVDVAEARRRSGHVDVTTGRRLDGRVQVPVDRRRTRAAQKAADGRSTAPRENRTYTKRRTADSGNTAQRRNGITGSSQAADRPLTAREREAAREAARRRRQEAAERGDTVPDRADRDRQDTGHRANHGRTDDKKQKKKKNKKSGQRRPRMTEADKARLAQEKETRRQEQERVREKKRREKDKRRQEKEKLRQVRAQKRQARLQVAKRVSKAVGKVLLVFAVCALVAFVIIRSFYKLEKVEVSGTNHYTDEQLTELVTDGRNYDNTLMFLLGCKVNQIPEITFIDKVDIKYVNRNTIALTAYEKAMAGCIKCGDEYAYFDGDGIVLELSDEKLDDVPCIEGLECDDVEQGSTLTVGDEEFFHQILTMTQIIYKNDIQIDKIAVDDSQGLLLYRGSIEIKLGDTDNLETKLMNLDKMLEKLDGKSGTLDLSAYDSTGGGATFRQNIEEHVE